MRLPILLAALAFPASSTAAPAPDRAEPRNMGSSLDRRNCPRAAVHRAEGLGKAESKRLGELPSGNLILAVVRDVNGCQEPVVVRYGYGIREPKAIGPVEAGPRRR